MFYQEGMAWANELVQMRNVRELVFGYLQEEKDLAALVDEVQDCGMPNAGKIVDILNDSGRKYLTLKQLGLS
jgi:glutamate dehydrogenase